MKLKLTRDFEEKRVRHYWTSEEDFLITNYKKMTDKDLASVLERQHTPGSVYRKRRQLKLMKL